MSNSVYPTLPGSTLDVDRESVYATIVQRESGGRELRVNTQTAARYRYRIGYDFLRQDTGSEAQTLLAFFAAHRGSWDSFLYLDPYNNTFSTLQSFGTGTGSQLVFYLVDEMGERVAGTTGTVSIYKGASLQTITTDYTYDATLAKVTFVVAPGAGVSVSWLGTYYRRVRFADDGLSLKRRFSRVWQGDVTLVSVLP